MTGFCRTHPWQSAANRWKKWGGLVGLLAAVVCARADVADAQRDFLDGDYADVIKQATAGVRDAPANIEWPILLIRALLTVGRNGEADTAMREALGREEQS